MRLLILLGVIIAIILATVIETSMAECITHTVVSGDNLWALKTTYNTSVDDIEYCNGLSNGSIQVGQVLQIPTTTIYGTLAFCSRSSDSWTSLATTYKMKPEFMGVLNDMDTGVSLKDKTCLTLPNIPSDPQFFYKMKAVKLTASGTNIVTLAGDWQSTPRTIRNLNGLESSVTSLPSGIYLGHDGPTRVLTPVTIATQYFFGNDDTIELVSAKYQVSVATLKAINNVPATTTNISVGNWLYIPLSDKSLKEELTEVKATAYYPSCGSDGCGMTSTQVDFVTADKTSRMRLVAVDPTVIPLGSVVNVDQYGLAAAWDIGTAVKGKHVDVLLTNEAETSEWGLKSLNVKVYEGEGGNDVIEGNGAGSVGIFGIVVGIVLVLMLIVQ